MYDTELIEDMIRLYRADYEVSGWRDCTVYAGMRELFARLKEGGTAACRRDVQTPQIHGDELDALELSPYFDFIGGAESDSSRDSKIEVIRYVMENLGMKDASGALMVGDRLYDIDGAKLAGMDSAGVLWGYGGKGGARSARCGLSLPDSEGAGRLPVARGKMIGRRPLDGRVFLRAGSVSRVARER